MMKAFFKTKEKSIVLLIAVCQLFITSCSRQVYPESSFRNIESNADRKNLNDFMAAGIEKGIDTHNASVDEIIETARKNRPGMVK